MAARCFFVVITALFAVSVAATAASYVSSFKYDTFSQPAPAGLVYKGNSQVAGTSLRLTSGPNALSYLWCTTPALVRGFEAKFTFKISSGDSSSQGIVFVIQNAGCALDCGSGFNALLGYHGTENSVAIEFDCEKNLPWDAPVVNTYHVSVHTKGTDANSADESASIGRYELMDQFCNAEERDVTIRYEPGLGLSIKMTPGYADVPFLTLSNFALEQTISLLDSDRAYIGFSATSGTLGEGFQDIEKWSYSFLGQGSEKSILNQFDSSSEAGALKTFQIITIDQYGNNMLLESQVNCIITNNQGFVNTLTPSRVGETGTYEASYAIKSAGEYKLAVYVNNQQILTSPFTINIFPGAIDGKQSKVIGEILPSITAGTRIILIVQAYDQYGNIITSSDDINQISATCVGAATSGADSITIATVGNGQYSIQVIATVKQNYQLTITVANQVANGFPTSFAVTPGPAYAANTEIKEFPTEHIAGKQDVFFLTAYDQYKNALVVGGDSFTASLSPTDEKNTAVIKNIDNTGTYAITVLCYTATNFVLDIQLGGADVGQSPYQFYVNPGPPDVSSCVAQGNGLIQGEAGLTSSFTVQIRDRYLNNYVSTPPDFALMVNITGPQVLPVTSLAGANGTILYNFNPTKSGAYYIDITSLDGTTPISNSPFKATVASGPTQAATSYVFEQYNFTSVKMNEPVFFLIQVADGLGNNKTSGGDQVIVTIENVDATQVQPQIIPTVIDGNNGTFSVFFTLTNENHGTFRMAVTINASPMTGSPFFFSVQEPVVDSTNLILWAICGPLIAIVLIGGILVVYWKRRNIYHKYMLVESQPDSLPVNGKSSTSYSLMPE